MVQILLDHSLCIAEDTPQGRHLVFPSQYRREKDIPWEPGVFVSYTFSGEWQTVWTTLVVRLWYSQEFEHPVYHQLWGEFVPHLSALDMLFCCGPETKDILDAGRRIVAVPEQEG
jgi:hypothetical protein